MPQNQNSQVVIGRTYRVRRARGTITIKITGTNARGWNAVEIDTNEETTVATGTRLIPVADETPVPATPPATVPVPERASGNETRAETRAIVSPAATEPVQRFSADCLAAVQVFKNSKPWKGTIDERQEKLRTLHNEFNRIYNLNRPMLNFIEIDPLARPGSSSFGLVDGAINLFTKLSVVTYFIAVCQARAFSPRESIRWAQELYRQQFPKSAARHTVNCGFVVPLE